VKAALSEATKEAVLSNLDKGIASEKDPVWKAHLIARRKDIVAGTY
jgi:hypothetical protein